MRLPGKVAIITGAGAGLGRTSALLFAEEGAKVVIAEHNAERADQVVKEITEAGGTALAIQVDVSDQGQVRAMTQQAVDHFGQLDILFCNAGIGAPSTPFAEQAADQWRRVFDVNVIGMLNCIQAATPHLRANGGGTILNCSSGAALAAVPGVPVYTATKGAINAMTRAFALDLGEYNIRVNTLCPMGGMSANFMREPDAPLVDEESLFMDYTPADSPAPLARPTPPRLIDHARAALFLVSDEAGWVNGVALPTDGGAVIRPKLDIDKTIRAYQTARFVNDR
ncbi:MAG TPA: SDR family oxidoreductase [Pseudonocardia sp.]|jgi:NAD(P)-dependent dehydrogenase (short-subunit alcohol dehydrogenase family)